MLRIRSKENFSPPQAESRLFPILFVENIGHRDDRDVRIVQELLPDHVSRLAVVDIGPRPVLNKLRDDKRQHVAGLVAVFFGLHKFG